MEVLFLAVNGPKFISFWDDVGYPLYCQRSYPIVFVIFRSEDIGR